MKERRREAHNALRGLSSIDRRLARLKREQETKKNERVYGISKHGRCKGSFDKNGPSNFKRLRLASKTHRFVPSNLPTTARFQGFRNIGNSCYMNAVIRSLLSLEPFVEELKRNERLLTCGRSPRPAFYASILAVVRQLEKSQHGVISLTEVKEAVAKNAKRFASYTQEDAHEFLVSSLSLLEDEVLAFKKGDQPEPNAVKEEDASNAADNDTKQLFDEDKPLIEPEQKRNTNESGEEKIATTTTSVSSISATTTTSTTSVSPSVSADLEDFREKWKAELNGAGDPKQNPVPEVSPEEIEALECPVATCFDCIVEVTIICKYCKQKSIIEELYRDFSLDIPQSTKPDAIPASLKELFANWFRPEEVMSLCEKCSHSEAIQKRRLKRLPLILTLHLKRFTYTLNSSSEYVVNKVFEYVPINKKLYIGNVHVEYLPEEGEEFDKIVQELEEKRQTSTPQAVVSMATETTSVPQETGETSDIAVTEEEKKNSSIETGIKRTRPEETPTTEGDVTTNEKEDTKIEESAHLNKRPRPNNSDPEVTGEETTQRDKGKEKETESQTADRVEEPTFTKTPEKGKEKETETENEKEKERRREKGKEKVKETQAANDDQLALASFYSSHPVLFNFDEPTKVDGFPFKYDEKKWDSPPPDILTQMQSNPFQMTGLYGLSSSVTRPSISSITNFNTAEEDELAKAIAASKESYELEQALKASEIDYFKQTEGGPPPEVTTTKQKEPAPPMPIEEDNSGEALEALGVYHLRSVLSHKGFSAAEGHYITDILEETSPPQWKCYNDAIVKKILEKKALGRIRQRNGYLFFYVQQQKQQTQNG